MAIQTQSFSTIVSNAVTAIQGAASELIDLTLGSVLRAVVEAMAGIALWLQGIALQIASLTRFATSMRADADSWGADFGYFRLPAKAASGTVTFSRFTPTAQALVPVGTIIQTADGSQEYTVVADTNQSSYDTTLDAYVIAAGISSCTATVEAVTAGSTSNALANLIDTMGQAIAGVDTVMNSAAFTNGADAESDPAYKTRFITYLGTLEKGTVQAVKNAIAAIQQNVYCTVTENETYSGSPDDGYFYVVVDDGTGNPSSGFLSTVYNAVDAVRPIGSVFGVFGPVLVTASVDLTITVASGYNKEALKPVVQAAITAYVNALGIGATLPFTKLAQLSYDASPGVTNVTTVTLNSGTADLTATAKQVIRAGTITVS